MVLVLHRHPQIPKGKAAVSKVPPGQHQLDRSRRIFVPIPGIAGIYPAGYYPKFPGNKFTLPVKPKRYRLYQPAFESPHSSDAFPQRRSKPIIAMDAHTTVQDAIKIGVIPQFITFKEPPSRSGLVQVLPEHHRPFKVEFGKQDILTAHPIRFTARGCCDGHHQEPRPHKSGNKERAEIQGITEFILIPSFQHDIHNPVRIIFRGDNYLTVLGIMDKTRIHHS
jgi:hypothetical protein